MEHKLELDLFIRWATKKSEDISTDKSDLVLNATEFFNTSGYNRNTRFPQDILDIRTTDKQGYVWHISYSDSRWLQWDKEVKIEYIGYEWEFNKI